MRYVTNIKLDQLIIHMLDTKGPDGLVLSERTIPLEGNNNLVDYFVGHIQNSLKNSKTKAASFVAMDSGITSGICKDLLDQHLFNWDDIPGNDTGKFIDFLKKSYNVDWIETNNIYKMDGDKTIKVVCGNNLLSLNLNSEGTQVDLIMRDSITKFGVKTDDGKLKIYGARLDLVAGSRKLAQKLYDIISEDKRIKACDLAVCLYQAESQDGGSSRYLALLNMEQSDVFRHKQEHDPQGRLYVSFEVDTEAMPTLGEKLQKCAFIRQLEPQPEYDMMMLDRQKQGKEVAKFFIDGFMGARPAFDARQRTTNLYRGLMIACNQIRSELKPNKIEYLEQAIQVAINSESFNIDTWVNTLSLSEEHKNKIEQELSKNLPDREFEIDKNYVEKLTRKRTFSGDGGLKVTIEADKYNKVIKPMKIVPDSGTSPYYRIEIYTKEWKEVPR